jgi:hypothetical protein
MLEKNDIDDVQECVSTHPNGKVYMSAYDRIKKALESAKQTDNIKSKKLPLWCKAQPKGFCHNQWCHKKSGCDWDNR